jgi:LacI family transcriptional regulator
VHRSVTACGEFEGLFAGVGGQLAAQKILSMPPSERPDAVVCANDQMAIGALRELQANGIRVPEDMAVVGFDDIYPGTLVVPALTTVRQPMRMLGARACSRLLERIADPALPHRVELLPTQLIVRESCGCGAPNGAAANSAAANTGSAAPDAIRELAIQAGD